MSTTLPSTLNAFIRVEAPSAQVWWSGLNRAIGAAEVTQASAAPNQVWFLFPKHIQDSDYREAWMESHVANMIAWQIRINREERGMSQLDLAEAMGTGQSAISKLEDP